MKGQGLDVELQAGIANGIMHVSRRLFQRSARVMENLNIGVGQVPILRLLTDNVMMTQRQIAEATHVTPATICGTLKRMERAGLIIRSSAEQDGRVSCVRLTESGAHCAKKAFAAIELPFGEMLTGFSTAECEMLRDFVRRMSDNLARATDGEDTDANR